MKTAVKKAALIAASAEANAPAELPEAVGVMEQHIAARFPGSDASIVGRAYRVADDAHRGQRRRPGDR